MPSKLSAALAVAITLCPASANSQDRWDEAEETIVRLAPAAFPELPRQVVDTLEARSCTIAQVPAGLSGQPNVARGEFLVAGSSAWVVLCSVERVSTILVLEDDGRLVGELSSAPDRSFMQGMGSYGIIFSRTVSTAPPAQILRYYEQAAAPGDELPEITHDGIDDGFMGKASTILYFTGDRWIELPGAD